MAVLAVLGAAVSWWYRRRRAGMVLLLGAAVAGVLASGFTTLYGRARPPVSIQLVIETNPSLPSGHTLGAVVVLGLLAALTWRFARPGPSASLRSCWPPAAAPSPPAGSTSGCIG